jgi:hypothetical protein
LAKICEIADVNVDVDGFLPIANLPNVLNMHQLKPMIFWPISWSANGKNSIRYPIGSSKF